MRLLRTFWLSAFLVLFVNMNYSLGGEFCVDTAAELQTALSAAENNGESDVIKVVQGIYNGNFSYSSGQVYRLELIGGYTAGCATQVVDPANSVLDGSGSERTLYLQNSEGGDLTVTGFTLQNGNTAGDGGGVYAECSSAGTAGDVTLSNNIIRMNTSSQGGAGAYARSGSQSGTAGHVVMRNNIITGNSANVGGGVFASSYSVMGTPGTVTFTNNTLTANSATLYGGGALLYAFSSSIPGGILNCYNNIFWSNTSPTGADINLLTTDDSTANAYNNLVSVVNGTWTNSGGNFSADPLFVDAGSGNYHIRISSPCRNAGLATAPEVPQKDFEGDPRVQVDIGADEYFQTGLPGVPLLLLE